MSGSSKDVGLQRPYFKGFHYAQKFTTSLWDLLVSKGFFSGVKDIELHSGEIAKASNFLLCNSHCFRHFDVLILNTLSISSLK